MSERLNVSTSDRPPSPCFSQVLILKEDKVVCFDTLLQVLILIPDLAKTRQILGKPPVFSYFQTMVVRKKREN